VHDLIVHIKPKALI